VAARRHEWRTRQRLPREEASGAEMKALGGLQLRLQHRLLLEPSQMGFSRMAPTLEQLGAPRIPLTGADMARWSHEIVAPSGSRGSSMPFCQPCPRMGLAGARFAGRWPADDVAGACGPWGGRGLRQPWGGGAVAAASRVRRQANRRGLVPRMWPAAAARRRWPTTAAGRRRHRPPVLWVEEEARVAAIGGGGAGRRDWRRRRRRRPPPTSGGGAGAAA